jgi:hypothetical protein
MEGETALRGRTEIPHNIRKERVNRGERSSHGHVLLPLVRTVRRGFTRSFRML